MRSRIIHWVQVGNQIQCEWHLSSHQRTLNPHYIRHIDSTLKKTKSLHACMHLCLYISISYLYTINYLKLR